MKTSDQSWDHVTIFSMIIIQLIPVVMPLIDLFADFAGFVADNAELIRYLTVGVLVLGGAFAMIASGGSLAIIGGGIAAIYAGITLLYPEIKNLYLQFKELAHLFFVESFASSFLEGLVKIGDAFFRMAEAAMSIISPMNAVKGAITAVGNTLGVGVDSGTYGAAMTSSTAASAKNTAAGLRENSAAVGGKQEITINVMVDRDKLATVVKEINGKFATDAIAGRA